LKFNNKNGNYDLTLESWTKGEIEEDAEGNLKNPDCSLSWKWGLNCVIPKTNYFLKDETFGVFGDAAKMNVAMSAGLLDGLLGTLKMLISGGTSFWEQIKPVVVKTGLLVVELMRPGPSLIIDGWLGQTAIYEALCKNLEETLKNAKKVLCNISNKMARLLYSKY
jgi:hypothetical protein